MRSTYSRAELGCENSLSRSYAKQNRSQRGTYTIGWSFLKPSGYKLISLVCLLVGTAFCATYRQTHRYSCTDCLAREKRRRKKCVNGAVAECADRRPSFDVGCFCEISSEWRWPYSWFSWSVAHPDSRVA